MALMIRVVQGARWGAALLALGLLLGPVGVSAADGDDEAEVEDAEHEVAQIKIEIKLESGRVVKPDDNFTVDFGVENALAVEADGSNHQFMLKVERKKEGKNKAKVVALTVGYDRDGEAIVAPYTFDAKVKKREVLRIEGGMALAFTITPKTIKGDAPQDEEEVPEEPKEKNKKILDVCDADDPLCGAK